VVDSVRPQQFPALPVIVGFDLAACESLVEDPFGIARSHTNRG
jgi:hypothetical protein